MFLNWQQHLINIYGLPVGAGARICYKKPRLLTIKQEMAKIWTDRWIENLLWGFGESNGFWFLSALVAGKTECSCKTIKQGDKIISRVFYRFDYLIASCSAIKQSAWDFVNRRLFKLQLIMANALGTSIPVLLECRQQNTQRIDIWENYWSIFLYGCWHLRRSRIDLLVSEKDQVFWTL